MKTPPLQVTVSPANRSCTTAKASLSDVSVFLLSTPSRAMFAVQAIDSRPDFSEGVVNPKGKRCAVHAVDCWIRHRQIILVTPGEPEQSASAGIDLDCVDDVLLDVRPHDDRIAERAKVPLQRSETGTLDLDHCKKLCYRLTSTGADASTML